MEVLNNRDCFITTLARLRESSKDAVVSANFSDEYTLYMHVDRPVQKVFEEQLRKSAASNHAELIMLCGSVGDGKSHILSYYRKQRPELMEKFYIHNDSTASLYIDKPASYTLKELLEDFADDKVEYSSRKIILAINLGTLSNFLDEDTEGRFTRLSGYISRAGVLERSSNSNNDDMYFHSVNFTDYHLYELTKSGPQSEYISALINKITNKDQANIFYNSYCSNCKECDSFSCCPIRINYDLLSDTEVQRGIVSVLIESIVKDKLIVSTRALLNFFYEIIVDERYIKRESLEPRKEPKNLNEMQYCDALLPCTLFNRQDSSELLKALHNMDPLHIRNEKIDDFFVYYENFEDVIQIFHDNLGEYDYVIQRFSGMDFNDYALYSLKKKMLYLFLRLCRLSGKRTDLLPEDKNYREFMYYLYLWNNGKYRELKQLYNDVERGILSWNGLAEKNEMQLLVANNNSTYHLYQNLEIKVVLEKTFRDEKEILYIFEDELQLKYKDTHKDIFAVLDLDFGLYALLKKVLNGYVPNVVDKRVNIKCIEFIRKISQGGSGKETLIIRDLGQSKTRNYRFEYEEGFEYEYTFEEI